MPGVDWIPGVSQVKSLCQLVTCDVEGAASTQENFAKECPAVSQITSGVQLRGDTEGALETQKRCLGTLNNVANGLPVVGHVKGVIHHAVGDKEGGNQAISAATRSTVVIGSGVAAGVASGGLAAIPAGMAAGAAYDITDTIISEKPKGLVAIVGNAIDNPSAGTIFDAAAASVGDGLAGYSGGQMGQAIAAKIEINGLEAARAVKTEQLNSALGGESSMTSGQVMSLGKEINTITSKINTLKHGSPQYYFDPKSKQVVVEQAAGSGTKVFVAVPGEGGDHGSGTSQHEKKKPMEKSEQKEETKKETERKNQEKMKKGVEEEEDGVQADCYAGQTEVALSPEAKEEVEKKYIEDEAKIGLKDRPRNPTVANKQKEGKIDNVINKNQRNPEENYTEEEKELFSTPQYLHVRMPPSFGYTGAIMLNDENQGLEHTFIRHWDQWLEVIPDLDGVFRRLLKELPPSIQELFRSITRVTGENCVKITRRIIQQLRDEINKLPNERYRLVMLEIQKELLKFLRRNITSVQYLGEGFNDARQVQVYFKIKDQKGRERVMVVCVSRNLYFPCFTDFEDPREVRFITTVFFKTMEEYEESDLKVGKIWQKFEFDWLLQGLKTYCRNKNKPPGPPN